MGLADPTLGVPSNTALGRQTAVENDLSNRIQVIWGLERGQTSKSPPLGTQNLIREPAGHVSNWQEADGGLGSSGSDHVLWARCGEGSPSGVCSGCVTGAGGMWAKLTGREAGW